eukprot:scaffold10650_cov169-Amphora_coffeaeformis.AAC.4
MSHSHRPSALKRQVSIAVVTSDKVSGRFSSSVAIHKGATSSDVLALPFSSTTENLFTAYFSISNNRSTEYCRFSTTPLDVTAPD